MKKMILLGVAALAVSVALPFGANAREVYGTPAHWGNLEKISGTVERVDKTKNEIVLQTEEGMVTLSMDKGTIISAWWRKLPLSRVKKGMWTTIEYEYVKGGSERLARWIDAAKTKAEMEKWFNIR
jgi:hypothetical protein